MYTHGSTVMLMVIKGTFLPPLDSYSVYLKLPYSRNMTTINIMKFIYSSIICPVYLITSNNCREWYIGESGRILNDRLGEHFRFARSTRFENEALAIRSKIPET